jgi:hypothetical protein
MVYPSLMRGLNAVSCGTQIFSFLKRLECLDGIVYI